MVTKKYAVGYAIPSNTVRHAVVKFMADWMTVCTGNAATFEGMAPRDTITCRVCKSHTKEGF